MSDFYKAINLQKNYQQPTKIETLEDFLDYDSDPDHPEIKIVDIDDLYDSNDFEESPIPSLNQVEEPPKTKLITARHSPVVKMLFTETACHIKIQSQIFVSDETISVPPLPLPTEGATELAERLIDECMVEQVKGLRREYQRHKEFYNLSF